MVGWLEFNVPFQHKYGCIRDENYMHVMHVLLAMKSVEIPHLQTVRHFPVLRFPPVNISWSITACPTFSVDHSCSRRGIL